MHKSKRHRGDTAREAIWGWESGEKHSGFLISSAPHSTPAPSLTGWAGHQLTWEAGKLPAGRGPPETESRAEKGEDDSEESRPGQAQPFFYFILFYFFHYFNCMEGISESFSPATSKVFPCTVSRPSLLNGIIQWQGTLMKSLYLFPLWILSGMHLPKLRPDKAKRNSAAGGKWCFILALGLEQMEPNLWSFWLRNQTTGQLTS